MALDMSQSPNEIRSIIQGWMKNATDNIHTALPGKIVSYSPGSNRASVQPNGNYKTEDGRNIPYPVIHNVPLHFPMGLGGRAGITFPINSGDGCLLVFQESQTDDYLSKGDSSDPRKHSLNDCIAIPGVYPGAVPSNISYPNDVCLFKGSSMLRLNDNEFDGSLGGTKFNFNGSEFSGSAGGTSFKFGGGEFSVDAGDSSLKFGGGDLVVNGISLVHHTHMGVHGETSPPL